ncbi:MAG: sodium/glutamate symporter [Gammaproteobacteria bacterium]|nr:sodium/glutamate symporter [Gammaproteobacteria bacterium]
MTWYLTTPEVLVLAIAVLWLGHILTEKIAVLRTLQLPPAVVGGLLTSILLAILQASFDWSFNFDYLLREPLLLVFFASIGLLAKFSDLKRGGTLIAKLAVVVIALLFLQNLVGVTVATLLDMPPEFGLIAGSISLAGGHGTAISWGEFFNERGVQGGMELGVAFATMGLVAGGLVGGPIAGVLMRFVKNGRPTAATEDAPKNIVRVVPLESNSMINAILFFAICSSMGAVLNGVMSERNLILPGFVTAMLAGVLIGNLSRWRGIHVEFDVIAKLGDVALNLFLAMSLMSLDLIALSNSLAALLVLLSAHIVLVTVMAIGVVFFVAGRNYDAVVISAGFTGIALGATPVGVANMSSVTTRYGASPRAFIVIPLLGAGLLDLSNATIIQMWLSWIAKI